MSRNALISFSFFCLISSKAFAQPAQLLPDLITSPSPLSDNRIDFETIPGKKLLRLSNSSPNVGVGSDKFLLEKISSAREISASDNGQVWIDLNKKGMLYLRIFFNNDRDLEPTSYKIMEGRSNVLEKCSNLERI